MENPDTPQKIGGFTELLPRNHGKTMLISKFRGRKGKIYDYTVFDYKNGTPASIIMPLTPSLEVVALYQFRHAADEWVYELPGGVPAPGDSPKEVARRELEEETGYRAQKVIGLCPKPTWFEPANFTVPYWTYAGLNCVKTKEPNPDKHEYLVVRLIPLGQWLEMIQNGTVVDSKSIAVTLLSLLRMGGLTKNLPDYLDWMERACGPDIT